MAIRTKACTWQRFPAALFIKLLKVVLTFDYIDDILILIIQIRATFQS